MSGGLQHLAVYAPFFDERPAGLGVYVDQILRRLAVRVRRVTVFTETPERVALPGVRLEAIPVSRARTAGLRLLRRQVFLQAELGPRLRRIGADALFVPYHDGCLWPTRPQFMVVHDLTPLVHPSDYYSPLLLRHLRTVLPRIIARTRKVFAVSENTRSDLQRLLGVPGDRIDVVTEGYDADTYRPRDDRDVRASVARFDLKRPYLLYAGTLAAHKNPRLAVELLDALRRRGIDVDLVFSGRTDAGDVGTIRSLIRERALQDRVRFVGYVSSTDLSSLMRGAGAFLYPSLYEGFGLSALEAMASGAIVVATSAASVPEVVGDGGVLLPPSDVGAWARTVERLLSDRSEGERLRLAAMRQATAFSWDDAAARILDVIEVESGARVTERGRA